MKRSGAREVLSKDLRKRLPRNYFIILVSKPSRKVRVGGRAAVPGGVPSSNILPCTTLRGRFRHWGWQTTLAVAGAWALPLASSAQAPTGPVETAATTVTSASAPALAAIPVPPIDSAALRRRRLRLIVGGTAWGYGVIYIGLTTAWYTGERVPLHWLNDLPEWQQLDKCGHF